jgi:hypothetical protein
MDITPLIRIGMTIIGLALATGQFRSLAAFARREAVRSAQGWHTPAFFPLERHW